MSAESTMGTWVRCRSNWSKLTSAELTTPFTPVSPDRPESHPGRPIRISRGAGVSHQGCTAGGGDASFDPSYVSGPARRTGAERKIVAIKNRLTIRFIKVD